MLRFRSEAIEQARSADIVATAAALGARLKRVTATELAGPCPICGGRDRFATNTRKNLWSCRGCGTGGDAVGLVRHVLGCGFREAVEYLSGGSISAPPETRPKPPAPKPPEQKDGDNRHAALALWRRRRPVGESDPVWRYLREGRRYEGLIPATIGFLPARGEHPPCMIAAIGMPDEPAPGVLAISDSAVRGVHLTRLKPDGSGKAGTAADKVTIGQGSIGTPIVLAPPNDLLALAITEGIEDGLSVHEATGLGAWAAVSAGRMPALADAVPSYVECVNIFGHRDAAGERGAHELAAQLINRRVETFLKFLEARQAS
jgi:putative DNA primase/helicase